MPKTEAKETEAKIQNSTLTENNKIKNISYL